MSDNPALRPELCAAGAKLFRCPGVPALGWRPLRPQPLLHGEGVPIAPLTHEAQPWAGRRDPEAEGAAGRP